MKTTKNKQFKFKYTNVKRIIMSLRLHQFLPILIILIKNSEQLNMLVIPSIDLIYENVYVELAKKDHNVTILGYSVESACEIIMENNKIKNFTEEENEFDVVIVELGPKNCYLGFLQTYSAAKIGTYPIVDFDSNF